MSRSIPDCVVEFFHQLERSAFHITGSPPHITGSPPTLSLTATQSRCLPSIVHPCHLLDRLMLVDYPTTFGDAVSCCKAESIPLHRRYDHHPSAHQTSSHRYHSYYPQLYVLEDSFLIACSSLSSFHAPRTRNQTACFELLQILYSASLMGAMVGTARTTARTTTCRHSAGDDK